MNVCYFDNVAVEHTMVGKAEVGNATLENQTMLQANWLHPRLWALGLDTFGGDNHSLVVGLANREIINSPSYSLALRSEKGNGKSF